jgi:hypothetical protein
MALQFGPAQLAVPPIGDMDGKALANNALKCFRAGGTDSDGNLTGEMFRLKLRDITSPSVCSFSASFCYTDLAGPGGEFGGPAFEWDWKRFLLACRRKKCPAGTTDSLAHYIVGEGILKVFVGPIPGTKNRKPGMDCKAEWDFIFVRAGGEGLKVHPGRDGNCSCKTVQVEQYAVAEDKWRVVETHNVGKAKHQRFAQHTNVHPCRIGKSAHVGLHQWI